MRILRGEAVKLKVFARPFVVNKYLKNSTEPKLHLGSGDNVVDGWLNADKFRSAADIYLNAYNRFPFPDNTFKVIYSEHMLEHVYIDKVPFLLKEVHRVLAPGGVFRVTVPDLEIHAQNYVNKNDEFFKPIIDKYMGRWDTQKNKYWLIRSNGGAFMTRAVQRFYRHRWMYDFETLSSCLVESGFSHCTKQAFQKSVSADAAKMDSSERACETLYIDALK